MHTAQRLLQLGHQITGLDNLNDYYDPQLKRDRLALLTGQPGFRFEKLDITDGEALSHLCLLYTSDAADERSSVDLGGRRLIKKKKQERAHRETLLHHNTTSHREQSKKGE